MLNLYTSTNKLLRKNFEHFPTTRSTVPPHTHPTILPKNIQLKLSHFECKVAQMEFQWWADVIWRLYAGKLRSDSMQPKFTTSLPNLHALHLHRGQDRPCKSLHLLLHDLEIPPYTDEDPYYQSNGLILLSRVQYCYEIIHPRAEEMYSSFTFFFIFSLIEQLRGLRREYGQFLLIAPDKYI